MQIIHKRSSSKNKKWLIIPIIAVVVLLAGAYLAYGYKTKKVWPFIAAVTSSENTDSTIRNVNQVDYGPPSSSDTQQSQDGKKNSATQEPTSPSNPTTSPSKETVSVGVTFADVMNGKVEVRAFVPGIIEGGTCTATLTKSGHTVTATSDAFIDSSSSQCSPIYIDVSKFPEKGTWTLVVSYASKDATGSSDKIEVTL